MTALPAHIWTPPRRPLWTPPPRPRLRFPLLTELFAGGLQRDPTHGGGKRHRTHGGGLRKKDGVGCCCKTSTYVRAKRCSDSTYADYCVVKGSVTLPYFAVADGACYSVEDGNTESSTPFGTILGGTSLSGCGDQACLWIQARGCDGTDADLWFPPGTTLPLYFELDDVPYLVNDGCNRSDTPGTPAAGYTVTAGCPASCCSSVEGTKAPDEVILTISGLTRCNVPCPDCPECDCSRCIGATPGNGSWGLKLWQVDTVFSTCRYRDHEFIESDGRHSLALINNGDGTMSVSVITWVNGDACGNVHGGSGGGNVMDTTVPVSALACSGSISGVGSYSGTNDPCNEGGDAKMQGTAYITVSW